MGDLVSVPVRFAFAFLLAALLCPSAASALTFKIDNQSGRANDQVFVTVAGSASQYDVPGMSNDVPKPLSSISGGTVTINQLVSGRIYIAYGAGVKASVPFNSKTRFDWAELTVTPNSSDVANLTAVDQFGIGMRLNTFDGAGHSLEEVGSANSNTVFDAMQHIPGGSKATLKDGQGKVMRVLSPNQTTAYPELGPYVKSMSGKTISLNTTFFGNPFTTSRYSGTFQSDGSIRLSGSTKPAGKAPAQINIGGSQLIADVYSGGNTPNNLSGALYRDLLAGFSSGMWGGKYGNSALSFCSDAITNSLGSWCPKGFNKPAFGDARKSLSSFPTCEQYAAVINKYSDSYGNPYSDASKKVTVSLDQPGTGGKVKTLQLTVLPDRGSAKPVESGNANCGAKSGSGGNTSVKVNFYNKANLKGKSAKAGKATCSKSCGTITVTAKKGKQKVAYKKFKTKSKKPYLTMNVNKAGRKIFKKKRQMKVKVFVKIQPSGKQTVNKKHSLTFTR
ncbi:MAG: hypothetical protein JJE13_02275 [Thermoleophilia bacterium]|nr:hypothetical protein [Thermoleophilia bacterium]